MSWILASLGRRHSRPGWWLAVAVGLVALPASGLAQSSSEETTEESAAEAASSSEEKGASSASGDGRPAEAAQGEENVESPNADGSGPGIKIDVNVSGKRVLTPMGVPDTRTSGDGAGDVADDVEETIRQDLELSGYFKVLPPSSYFFDTDEEGMSGAEIEFKNWFNVGARGLIKSSVEKSGDEVRLDLRLFEVDTGERVQLDWEPTTVAPDGVVGEVHTFMNLVLKHYTGKAGVFGSEIAYVKRNDRGHKQIFVSQMDGSKRRQITDNRSINMLPAWGDGSVYFTSYKHDNPDLWRWRDGTTTKISSRAGQNSGASYCGGTLAVTLSMGGENADVYLIDPESGEVQKRLTDNWAIDTSPSFSPDCSQIAFVSGRSGSPQIYVMNADGSDVRRLTFEGSYNTSPDWSPEGDEIAFTARDKYNHFDIFLVDLEGNLTRLTQDQGNNEEPSFGPDGRYIVFSSDRGGKGNRLWLMTSDGQIQNPITPSGSGFHAPTWRR